MPAAIITDAITSVALHARIPSEEEVQACTLAERDVATDAFDPSEHHVSSGLPLTLTTLWLIDNSRKQDADDEVHHPFTRAQQPAYFTLCGAVILNIQLLEHTESSTSRTQWKLHCPLCKSFIGFWICAPSDVELSPNQKRKNRNTNLMGK